jgi:hypothetical protein
VKTLDEIRHEAMRVRLVCIKLLGTKDIIAIVDLLLNALIVSAAYSPKAEASLRIVIDYVERGLAQMRQIDADNRARAVPS